MFEILIFSACLYVANSAPSLPTYKAIHATSAPLFAYEQPQEEYYAQQYMPTDVAGDRTRERTVPANYNCDTSATDDSKPKDDALVINPTPSTQFLLPPKDSVIPKLTGSYIKNDNDKAENSGPITNPAAYFLAGADIENVAPAKCRMTGCDGPAPNDYNYYLDSLNKDKYETCHHAFVPLNGCLDNRGHPVGMICTICCDCTADFASEMKKSRVYVQSHVAK